MTKEEERLKLILSSTTEGWWEWDVKTNTTYHSPQWFRMLGYHESDLDSSIDTWLKLLHPHDREWMFDKQKELIEQQDRWELQFRMRNKDGSYIPIRSIGRVVNRDQKGKALKAVGIHLDQTVDQKLEQLLEEKVSFLQELAFFSSHDLRSPVGTILGLIALIKADHSNLEDDKIIDYLEKMVLKLDKVIHELHKKLEENGNK